MRKPVLVAACLIGLAAAGGLGLYATYQREYLVTETEKAEFIGLQQSLGGLESFAKLGGDGAFVALDKSLFDKISAALSGQSVTVYSKSLDDQIRLTVRSATLRAEPGRMVAQLALTATDTKRGLGVGLDVEGFVYYAGITEEPSSTGGDPANAANFKFLPVKIIPQLQYGFLNLRGRQFVSDTVTTGVLSFLFDKLAWKATYQPHVDLAIGSPSTITQHFGDNNAGTVVFTATPSPFRFDRWLTIVAPVFTPKGVVLTATLESSRQAPSGITPARSDKVKSEDLANARAEIAAKAGALNGLYARDVAVTIGRAAFGKLTEQFITDLSGFNISIKGQSIAGRLFDKQWRDNILGDGGYYAEIVDAARIEGRVSFGKSSAALDKERGPYLTMPVSASFGAPVHVHFDPLIGGGFGTSVGIQGSASTTLRAWFATTKFVFEGRTVSLAGPVLSCELLDVDARTDGRLKLGGDVVVATVPSLGAKVGVLIGDKPLAPSVVAGAPILATLVPSTKQEERATASLSILDGLFSSLTVDDLATELGEDGYRISTSFSIELGNQPFASPPSDFIERMRKAATDHWNSTMRQQCPDTPGIRIEVGDLEIGPNGEVLKFLKNAWNDITKGPGKNNEVRKLVDRINGEAAKYDEATKQLANDVGNLAKQAFPTDSGVGHAAGELAKSVTKVITNPGGAVQDFGKQLFNGFR